jgi:uncharacterized delta-60 repeat protein
VRGLAPWIVIVASMAACGVEDLRDAPPVTQPPVQAPPEPAPPPPLEMVVEPRSLTVAPLQPATVTVRVPDRAKLASVLNVAAANLPIGVSIGSGNIGVRDDVVTLRVTTGSAAEIGKSKARLTLSSIRGVESTASIDVEVRGRPGTLDATFGDGLIVRTAPTGVALGGADALAIQPDGKIVVLSRSNGRTAVMRFGTRSEWDAGFGSNGLFVSAAADVSYESPSCLALDANANVLVGGLVSMPNGTYSGMLMRLTPAGRLDTSFGPSGRLAMPDGSWIRGLAVDESGAVLVAGQGRAPNGSTRAFVQRLTRDGKLDPSFAATWTEVDERSSPALAIATTGRDRAIVATNAGGRLALFGIHASGSLDTSFGDRGYVVLDPASTIHPNGVVPPKIAAQADGRFLVSGTTVPSASKPARAAAVRLTAAGLLDATFGESGLARSSVGTSSTGNDVAVDASGRSLLVGSAENQQVPILERRLPDGRLDTTFGVSGVADARGARVSWNAVAVAKDGRIVVAGGITGPSSAIALARYWD